MAYVKTNWVDNTTPIDKNNLNKIESGIKNNDINIGEENYDNTKTYEVGDIVRYNEKIYKCITAITTAENFDISKWEQTNIVEIVQSEKSKIYELIEALSTPIVGEGENITLNDTAEKRFENFDIEGNSEQEATPSPDYPSEVKSCGDNGSINEVVCNKNLFDKNKIFAKSFYNQIGTIIQATGWKLFELIPKENTDYVLKVNNSSSNIVSIVGVNNDNSITIISDLKLLNKFNSKNYKKIRYSINNNDLDNCQLEEGTTATPYEEHQEQSYTIPTQQPMRSIGDTRDKFILKENGKWYERHYVQRLILNGTEGWNFDNNNNRFYFGKAGNKGSGYIMSSHYLTGDTTKQNNTCEIWTGAILFRDERYTNVNDWKSYLAEQYANGTPVYVDYVLATPTDIECTSQQTEILNQMYIKAKSYKGVTHIYSNDEVSPNCYVEAVKDLTTLIQ